MTMYVISELVALAAIWNCQISYKNRYAGLLVLHLLPLLNPWWLIVTMQPAEVFSVGIILVDIHLSWLNWFNFLILREVYSIFNNLLDFCVTNPRCYKDVYVNSFSSHTARLWNYLPIECFPLTFDLNGFKSRINRRVLTVGSF